MSGTGVAVPVSYAGGTLAAGTGLRGLSLFLPLPLPHCPAAVYQIFAEEYRLRRQYQADQHDDPV